MINEKLIRKFGSHAIFLKIMPLRLNVGILNLVNYHGIRYYSEPIILKYNCFKKNNPNEYGSMKLKDLRNYRRKIIKETPKLELNETPDIECPQFRQVNKSVISDIDNLYNQSKKYAHIRQLGRIYLLFKQIFDEEEFTPEFTLDIDYYNQSVFYGNFLAPSEVENYIEMIEF